MSRETSERVLSFWFEPPICDHWFSSTPEIDQQILSRFVSLWQRAAIGRCDDWMEHADGALALVIVLDQFPLNMFRNDARAFATQEAAIRVTRRAIEQGFDQQLQGARQAFLYLPLMHSERLADQERSVALFAAAGLQENLRFAEHHRDIVRRFGRFPHRNAILGRASTREEMAYLASSEAFTG